MRLSKHKTDTAATFIPIENNLDEIFNLEHRGSSLTIPEAMPSMFVCIAPLVATIQISELFTTTLGALAVGTDLSITVELTVFVSALLVSVATATKVIAVSKINNVFIYHKYTFHLRNKD